MFIQTENTPNPQVLKFLPGRTVMEAGSQDFRAPEEAEASPLASEIFGLDGVNRVFFGADFITVGKAASADWDHLKAPVLAAIMDHFTSGRPLFDGDGGDILFDRFEPDSGTVWLHMRGACAGCPSSSATLKSGVENMLKHYVPEVTRVEQTL